MTYTNPALDAKLGEIEAVLDLLRETLAGLKKPPAPVIHGIDANLPAGLLTKNLWQRLGQRRFRLVMTKMANFDREIRQDARLERRLANANGHGTPVVVVDRLAELHSIAGHAD
jgi:hypothetical protein